MSLSKYDIFIALVVIIILTGAIGSFAGFTVNGTPFEGALPEGAPGLLGALDYVFEAIAFLVLMTLFQVDGVPWFISLIFLFINLLTVYLIVNLVRGNS